ncbi:MAG: hypothetical protein MJZ90_10075 [Bacteroidales bacterium]|nr:hypothetical protein [Bacteroidales bacterium]
MSDLNLWISKATTKRNEIFICPFCNGEVRYSDGACRRKQGSRVAKCGYRYCPHCAEVVNKEPNDDSSTND